MCRVFIRLSQSSGDEDVVEPEEQKPRRSSGESADYRGPSDDDEGQDEEDVVASEPGDRKSHRRSSEVVDYRDLSYEYEDEDEEDEGVESDQEGGADDGREVPEYREYRTRGELQAGAVPAATGAVSDGYFTVSPAYSLFMVSSLRMRGVSCRGVFPGCRRCVVDGFPCRCPAVRIYIRWNMILCAWRALRGVW